MSRNTMMRKQVAYIFLLACFFIFSNKALAEINLALGKPYVPSCPAKEPYDDPSGKKLTDGEKDLGAEHTNKAWQGRQDTYFYHTIDLGSICKISQIEGSFMRDLTLGIDYPYSVNCAYSLDGNSFMDLGNAYPRNPSQDYDVWSWNGLFVNARYVRIYMFGKGHWIFEDEIEVWGDTTPAAPTNLHYPQSSVLLALGRPMGQLVPTVSGGANVWSITPALPKGLNFDTSSGIISGTPAELKPSTCYTVTAANSIGSTSSVLEITVLVSCPDNDNNPGEPNNPVHEGIATFCIGDGTGACMFDPDPNDLMYTGINPQDYQNAQACGARIEVIGPKGTIQVRVTDLCPECQPGQLDLSRQAYEKIGDLDLGSAPIKWRIITASPHGPIEYHFKDGSNWSFTMVQVRNHKNPVAKLEYLNNQSKWITVPRTDYNYFIQTSPGMGIGPYTFRVTDIYGHVLIDKNIPHLENGTAPGAAQFP